MSFISLVVTKHRPVTYSLPTRISGLTRAPSVQRHLQKNRRLLVKNWVGRRHLCSARDSMSSAVFMMSTDTVVASAMGMLGFAAVGPKKALEARQSGKGQGDHGSSGPVLGFRPIRRLGGQFEGRLRSPSQCLIFLISSVISGTALNKSATRPKSATLKIGASSSLLIATIVFESFMPARC
jgi:hypothetical protein